MCPKMPRNMQKSSFRTCRVRFSIPCLVVHIADKGVTWRRVALTKKRWKKREVRGGEGKLLENCGKKVKKREGKREKGKKGEKRKHWRKREKGGEAEEKGGKERTREMGRLGSPEGRRPVTRCRKRRWNFACHVPSTFARKVTMFGPPRKKDKKCGKNRKKCTFEQSAHWFVALGSAISGNQAQGNDLGQTALVQEWPNNCEKNTENATKLTAHSSHHCPKIIKTTSKTRRKRQIHIKNQQKYHKTRQKNDNLMSKIDQQRVLCFRNL